MLYVHPDIIWKTLSDGEISSHLISYTQICAIHVRYVQLQRIVGENNHIYIDHGAYVDVTCRHNNDTAITYHNNNESITYINNYYDLSYHATHFIFYIDVCSFVQKQPRDINMTVHSGIMKCCTSILIWYEWHYQMKKSHLISSHLIHPNMCKTCQICAIAENC